jgi:hypothetical protein
MSDGFAFHLVAGGSLLSKKLKAINIVLLLVTVIMSMDG